MVSLREYGDNMHLVAYVEKEDSIYNRIRNFKGVVFFHPYYLKGKLVATDFFFNYRERSSRSAVTKRLEKLLSVKVEK